MNTEPRNESSPEDPERSEREAAFTRRGLLQWSVPVILAASLPRQVSAGSFQHDDHVDDGHADHADGHYDMHEDGHFDYGGWRP